MFLIYIYIYDQILTSNADKTKLWQLIVLYFHTKTIITILAYIKFADFINKNKIFMNIIRYLKLFVFKCFN